MTPLYAKTIKAYLTVLQGIDASGHPEDGISQNLDHDGVGSNDALHVHGRFLECLQFQSHRVIDQLTNLIFQGHSKTAYPATSGFVNPHITEGAGADRCGAGSVRPDPVADDEL